MTDAQIEVKRGFWAELFTGPRLVTFGICLVGGGAWVQALRSDVVQLRERVLVLEQRVDRQAQTTAETYMRRDNLTYELTAIRDEIARQRLQIEGLRKDLR